MAPHLIFLSSLLAICMPFCPNCTSGSTIGGVDRLGETRERNFDLRGWGQPSSMLGADSLLQCSGIALLLSVALTHTLQGSLTDSTAHISQEKISTPPAEDIRAARGAHLRRPLLETSGSPRALSPG